MTIRVMNISDYDKVYNLWMSCKNMGFNDLDDSREGIEKYLRGYFSGVNHKINLKSNILDHLL